MWEVIVPPWNSNALADPATPMHAIDCAIGLCVTAPEALCVDERSARGDALEGRARELFGVEVSRKGCQNPGCCFGDVCTVPDRRLARGSRRRWVGSHRMRGATSTL